MKKKLTPKYRRLSSICAILPLLLSLALPASPFQFAPLTNPLLTQRQCSLAQEHAEDCNKQHCPLHGDDHQTAPACHLVTQLIMLILHMSHPALCQRLHNNCRLACQLHCFHSLYINFLEVYYVFVKSNVGSQSSGTWLRGNMLSL